jgi:hypothetical protein
MIFAWGSDTGRCTTALSSGNGSRGKGGFQHRWIACRQDGFPVLVVDTAVSIEREVVSGHAYAILAPQAAEVRGRCGYDKPTKLSVDGVVNP